MASFKSARDLLLVSLQESLLDEEGFLLLHDLNTSSNAEYPYKDYTNFNLQAKLNDAESKSEFRHVNLFLKCDQGTACEGEEAFFILLKRFAYPCRYSDMISLFGRQVPELSMINNKMIDFIYDTHGHRLMQCNHQILNSKSLETYAEVISAKEAALTNCFGFVDGTVRQISRPGKNQRIYR